MFSALEKLLDQLLDPQPSVPQPQRPIQQPMYGQPVYGQPQQRQAPSVQQQQQNIRSQAMPVQQQAPQSAPAPATPKSAVRKTHAKPVCSPSISAIDPTQAAQAVVWTEILGPRRGITLRENRRRRCQLPIPTDKQQD